MCTADVAIQKDWLAFDLSLVEKRSQLNSARQFSVILLWPIGI
jgi:hypothetical protein